MAYLCTVMNVPLRKISLLVVLSLTAIFAYQVWWLVGLYHTRLAETKERIEAAMTTADVREMLVRVSQLQDEGDQHGDVQVSAGYQLDGTTVFQTTTNHRSLVGVSSGGGRLHNVEVTMSGDSTSVTTIRSSAMRPDTMSEAEGNALLQSMADGLDNFSVYLQRAMHSGIGEFRQADIAVFDSILCHQLEAAGLLRPHRTEFVQYTDSMLTREAVVASVQTVGYHPSERALTYSYFADIPHLIQYRLTMEPVTDVVLRQMAGILGTSLFILLVLALAFVYLIRTLLRMRTLDEMKTDFTNNITHELKTPIAVAYAANDALLNFNAAADGERARQYLTISQLQLQRLGGMVEQILSMSMERRRTLTLRREDIAVRELAERLMDDFRLKADKPVDISYEEEPAGVTVCADRAHLYNMLGNLLDNAVKYSADRAIIYIRCRRTEAGVEISVADRGIGIPADKLPYVFDRFYRVPSGNLHDVKGYGLGLFYVRQLMEKHGGTVTAQSEVGKGSTFTLSLSSLSPGPSPIGRGGQTT